MAISNSKLYPNATVVGATVGAACSASAASSGSSSGHSRSNHTQHSIVSVHGGPPVPSSGPFESYRPMIGPFGSQTTTIQEVSPQIYNEPTNGSNYYQSASDRSGNNSGGSNGIPTTGNANTNNTGPSNSSFSFHSMHHPSERGPRANIGHFGGNVHSGATIRSSVTALNRHLAYDQSMIGPKF